MKKMILLASISQLALIAGGSANAADLPGKAPSIIAAAPVYSWTGCYAGAHLGWGWNRQDVTDTDFSQGPSGPIAKSGALKSGSGIFGGQAGCNYQFAGNWVAGIQGDLAGTDFQDRVSDPFDRLTDPANSGTTIGVKTDWLASVTARLGVTAWDNRALFYVKGGAAWAHNRWDFTQSYDCRFLFAPCRTPTAQETRTGWTVGGGVEWVIAPSAPNWTAFAEYNYYGFSDGRRFVQGDTATVEPRNAIVAGSMNIQTVKAGVNYKLFTP